MSSPADAVYAVLLTLAPVAAIYPAMHATQPYTVSYVDVDNQLHTFELLAKSQQHAMLSAIELRPDIYKIKAATPAPEF